MVIYPNGDDVNKYHVTSSKCCVLSVILKLFYCQYFIRMIFIIFLIIIISYYENNRWKL